MIQDLARIVGGGFYNRKSRRNSLSFCVTQRSKKHCLGRLAIFSIFPFFFLFGFALNVHAQFVPTDLPNLKLWLDPAIGTYSDVGLSTPVSTDGSSVKGWADQSGIGNNATGTAGAILKSGANGINGRPALNFTTGNGRLYTPSFLSSSYDHAVTTYVVTTPASGQGTQVVVANQGLTSYVSAAGNNSGGWTPLLFAFKLPVDGSQYLQTRQTTDQVVYVTSESLDGTSALFRNNNILTYQPSTASAGLIGPLAIGGADQSTSFTWTGLVGDILIYNGGHTRAQQEQVTDYLMQKYGAPTLYTLPNVALQGNSLVRGVGAVVGDTDIGTDIATILGKSYQWTHNGISGRTIDQMITDAPAEIDPSINPDSANIYFGWEITNQMNSSNPVQIMTKLQSLFDARRTAGWDYNITADMLPSTSCTGACETNRSGASGINTLLATAFPTATIHSYVYKAGGGTTMANYLVRVSEIPELSDPTNSTYYFDGTHLKPAGYAVAAPVFANAIMLTNDLSVAPTVSTFGIPATSNSLTVSITTPFTATDNVGVTGYMATTTSTVPSASDSTWQGTAPTSYTFSSAGSKTLYAWAKDAAGNVSTSLSSSVTITLPSTETTITSFDLASPSVTGTVNNTTHTVSLSVPYGTAVTALTPTIVLATGATISPTSGTATDFTTPQTYTVTAEDGTTTQTYTVTVTVGSAPETPASTTTVTTVSANGPIVGANIVIPGQVKPRNQIIYPDGRIVYLDEPSTTPIQTQTQTQKTNTVSSTTTTYTFTRDLSLHSKGPDVKALQQYLNANGFIIAKTGAGSPGNETTQFGSLTYRALVKFQKSVGLPATGYFGKMTRVRVGARK